MSDLISRQAVIDCFKKWQPYMATRLHEFEKELFDLPSAEKTETVTEFADRCRECGREKVLDKIRAEIEQLHYHPKLDFMKNDEVVEWAVAIIDKYKAESEVQE